MAKRTVLEFTCDRCGKKEYIELHGEVESDIIVSFTKAGSPKNWRRVCLNDLCDDCFAKFMDFMNAVGRCEEEDNAVE